MLRPHDFTLALIQDCEGAYLSAADKLRRQFNQAFFKRILIDDTYTVTGELAEPFDTLLSEEIRLAATRRAHLELMEPAADLRPTVRLLQPNPKGPGFTIPNTQGRPPPCRGKRCSRRAARG